MKESSKEKLLKRINKIRQTLESEEKKFGWIKDRRELRYLPSEMYIKIGDFAEGLNYLKWFHKNFPKDKGFPEFLYEWTVILFKNDKLKEARQKAFETHCSNIYLFDKYFGNKIIQQDIFEKSKTESYEQSKFIHLSSGHPELLDFDKWLRDFISSKKFIEISKKFIELRKELKVAGNIEQRKKLQRQEENLIYEL